MNEDSLRPQYKIEELPTAQPPQPVVAENPLQVSFPEPNLKPKSQIKFPHINKFIFLIPAVVLVLVMFLASYFTRTDYVQRPLVTPMPIAEIAKETPSATPVAQNSLVSFTREKYSFSYPDKFKLYECSGDVYLSMLEEEVLLSEFCANPISNEAIVKVSENSSAFNTSELDILAQEDILVSGFTTKEYEYRGAEGSNLYVELEFKEEFYLFELFDPQYKNDFNKILGTFELIYDKTENWQTFNNPQFAYSIQYPEDWILVAETDDQGNYETANFKISKSLESEMQSFDFRLTTSTQQSAASTASEIISSTRSLPGWKSKPISEFRNIGGANATVIKGIYENIWNAYAVIWYRSNVIEIVWQDTTAQEFQETFELMLASLKLS